MAELRTELRARSLTGPTTARVLVELGFHLLCALGGIALFVIADALPWQALGLLIMTLGNLGVGTNTHTASHHAASSKRWVNDLLTWFGYPFFLGMSATSWRYQHVTLHHRSPNVAGVDGDSNLMPLFALTEPEVQARRGLHRIYLRRAQWLVLPMLAWATGFARQKKCTQRLISVLRDPEQRRWAHWTDAGALVAHVVAWFVVPSLFFPVLDVIGFNLLRVALVGYPLFAVLAPAHYPAGAVALEPGAKPTDAVRLQTATTINFRTGPLGRLWCSGLEYQIEHHLFPTCSHVHYRTMSPLVKAYCDRHGYQHRTLGWAAAIWQTLRVFRRPKPVVRHVDELRVTEMGQREAIVDPVVDLVDLADAPGDVVQA